MSQQRPSQEKMGWVEAALILLLVVTVVIVILGLLGPAMVNLTVAQWVTTTLATISGFVVKYATILGLAFVGILITIVLLYIIGNRR